MRTRAALPLLEPEGTRAHRARPDIESRCLDHLARHGADETEKIAHARIIGLGHADLQRVAVDRAQAFDRRVVVELAVFFAASITGRAPRMRSVSTGCPARRRFGSSQRL
jgi:hypothetical protein